MVNKAQVGYQAYEDTRTFEKGDGKLDGFEFPNLILEIDSNNPIPKSRMMALKGMLDGSLACSVGDVTPINLYAVGDKTMLLGKLQARQVKSFLKLFGEFRVYAYLDKNTLLEGDNIYVLSD